MKTMPMSKRAAVWGACLFMILSVSLHGGAAPIEEEKMDGILEAWGLDASQVLWQPPDQEALGPFTLTPESAVQTAYTFSQQFDLTGTAEPGTFIYYGILTEERNELSVWDQYTVEAGGSGLIQERISLPRIGTQYLVVIVRETAGEKAWGTIYTVCRRSRRMEEELKNLQMNLYEKCAQGAEE